MPVRELAELSESDNQKGPSKASARLRVAQFKQKDDYRGRHPLLRCMSMVTHSCYVRRVDRSKAGKPDGVRFFEFETHYPHFENSLQEPRMLFVS